MDRHYYRKTDASQVGPADAMNRTCEDKERVFEWEPGFSGELTKLNKNPSWILEVPRPTYFSFPVPLCSPRLQVLPVDAIPKSQPPNPSRAGLIVVLRRPDGF
jgi:hypothetical protein